MAFFFCILILLAIFWRLLNSKIAVGIILLGFALLIGLRSFSVGVDTGIFYNVFNDLCRHGYRGYPELLYAYLNILVGFFSKDYHAVTLTLATIFVICCYAAIRRASPLPGYSVFVLFAMYFVFYAMNISRQMTAVPIVFLAYTYLANGRKWTFIAMTVLASFIHASAITALLALALPYVNLHRRDVIVACLAVTFVVGLALSDGMFQSIGDAIGGDYGRYLYDKTGRNGFRSESRLSLAIMLTLFWDALFLFVYIFIKPNLRNNLWVKLYFAAILFVNLTTRMELGIRVVLYFSICQCIVYPMFLKNNTLRFKPMGEIVISTMLIIFFSVFLSNNSAGILPYSNIWFKV